MSMLTENRMRSTSIERFRENQAKRKGHSFVAVNEVEDDNEVSWKQILITFASLFTAGAFFLFVVFGLAFLSILF